jgi:hypothetical protein
MSVTNLNPVSMPTGSSLNDRSAMSVTVSVIGNETTCAVHLFVTTIN